MNCPECELEIAACPRCGSSLEGGGPAPEEIEGTEGSEGVAAAAKAAPPGRPGKVPWQVLGGAMALLAVSLLTMVLAFVLLPWGGSKPEDTVKKYFKAFEEDRQGDVFGLYDPVDLEAVAAMYGMNIEEFESVMAEENAAAAAGSIQFEGLAYTIAVEETAKVEITSGTANITDVDGQTTSEDMAGTVIRMVKRDGQWYLKMLSEDTSQN